MLLAICNKCWYQVAGGVAGAIHPHARGRTTTRSIMAHAPDALLALVATARLVGPVPCPPQPPRSQVCLHANNSHGAVGLFPYAPVNVPIQPLSSRRYPDATLGPTHCGS